MDYESTLLTKPECLVYRLPPRTTVRGYRAADWGLDKPAWTGRMRVTAKGKAVSIKVLNSNPESYPILYTKAFLPNPNRNRFLPQTKILALLRTFPYLIRI